jgi:hypothetical protein
MWSGSSESKTALTAEPSPRSEQLRPCGLPAGGRRGSESSAIQGQPLGHPDASASCSRNPFLHDQEGCSGKAMGFQSVTRC